MYFELNQKEADLELLSMLAKIPFKLYSNMCKKILNIEDHIIRKLFSYEEITEKQINESFSLYIK